MIPLFIFKGVELSKELFPVDPWLWAMKTGCQKNVQHHWERFHKGGNKGTEEKRLT